MSSKTADQELDLESQEFREALLSRLNGQSEDLQRIIKMVDNRFRSQATRTQRQLASLETEISEMRGDVSPILADVKIVKRLAVVSSGAVGLLTGLLALLRVLGAV